MRTRSALPLLAVLLAAHPVVAQQPVTDSVPRARAVRAEQAPVIDGREDDAVWRTIPPTSDFFEFQPTEGKAPRFKTEFKAAYDDRNHYGFVRAYDPHPDSIMTALTRRDERGPSDQLKIMIDSYHDRRSGFEFAVNPVGVKRDYAMYNDAQEDQSWDGIWPCGAHCTPCREANCLASAADLSRSAGVSPPARSYTITAGIAFGDWKVCWTFSTFVDSALPGSHADTSFCWAPVSFPDSGPARPATSSQKTSARNLVRRPVNRPDTELSPPPWSWQGTPRG